MHHEIIEAASSALKEYPATPAISAELDHWLQNFERMSQAYDDDLRCEVDALNSRVNAGNAEINALKHLRAKAGGKQAVLQVSMSPSNQQFFIQDVHVNETIKPADYYFFLALTTLEYSVTYCYSVSKRILRARFTVAAAMKAAHAVVLVLSVPFKWCYRVDTEHRFFLG